MHDDKPISFQKELAKDTLAQEVVSYPVVTIQKSL